MHTRNSKRKRDTEETISFKKRKIDNKTSHKVNNKKNNVQTKRIQKETKRCQTKQIKQEKTDTKKTACQSLKEKGTARLAKKVNIEYLSSSMDRPELVFVKKIKWLEGYGLFAAQKIQKGTIIGEYTGEILKKPDPNSHYGMDFINNTWIDATKKGNLVRFANFSEYQFNAQFIKTINLNEHFKKVVVLESTVDIEPNQQILVNYGVDNTDDQNTYKFLHPDDTWQFAETYVTFNKGISLNKVFSCTQHFPHLKLFLNDTLYTNQIGLSILEARQLTDNSSTFTYQINDRFFKCTVEEQRQQFDDTFYLNSLMIACYLGQLNNVQWLIDHGADINRQQIVSGKSSLFFPVQGFTDGQCSEKNCIKIIEFLIQNHANILIQDNKSQIFLFDVLKHLSEEAIEQVITLLLKVKIKNKQITLDVLNDYVNKQNDDLIIYIIKKKKFHCLKLFLELSPHYLTKNIRIEETNQLENESGECSDSEEQTAYYTDKEISNILEEYHYSQLEKEKLKAIFKKHFMSQEMINTIFAREIDNKQNQKRRK